MASSFSLTAVSTEARALGDAVYGADLTVQNLSDTVTVWLFASITAPTNAAAVVSDGIRIPPGGQHKSQDPNGHNLGQFFVATETGTAPIRGIA